MRFKVLVALSLLIMAATGALAREPAKPESSGAQNVTSQITGLGDDTTGPTKPRASVQSPDWI
jgi:hypothetical protein